MELFEVVKYINRYGNGVSKTDEIFVSFAFNPYFIHYISKEKEINMLALIFLIFSSCLVVAFLFIILSVIFK